MCWEDVSRGGSKCTMASDCHNTVSLPQPSPRPDMLCWIKYLTAMKEVPWLLNHLEFEQRGNFGVS